ncbi:MAG: hypothetical protein IT464_05745 [Planctomycetes bacterium]|nr:hypothetical protein [Planctomycetota bacterium]
MAEQEGSKAMSIYIVACFALAMVALIGYKFTNDQRDTLSGDYVAAAGKFADISVAYSPNIGDYYYKVKQEIIKPPDREMMNNTHVTMRSIAAELNIQETDNRFNVTPGRGEPKKVGKERYLEYKCKVTLDSVTQTEWTAFLQNALQATDKYAVTQSISIERKQRTFGKVDIVKGNDLSQWKVTIEFVWFGPERAT